MGQPDAIVELKGEHHLLMDLIREVGNLIGLMRDLPGPPDDEIRIDLLDATNLLTVRMRSVFEEEERLIYPAVRRYFKVQESALKACETDHADLKLSIITLDRVADALEVQWNSDYIEQVWALVDHIREVFQQHIECEHELFDHIDGELTLGEHRDLVNSLRRRRNLRIPTTWSHR